MVFSNRSGFAFCSFPIWLVDCIIAMILTLLEIKTKIIVENCSVLCYVLVVYVLFCFLCVQFFLVLVNGLARNNVSEITCFVSS